MTDAKAKDHYSFEELMTCARGEMYGPGNAQLPAPPMLLFDRITKINDDGGAARQGLHRGRVRHRSRASGSSTATSSATR